MYKHDQSIDKENIIASALANLSLHEREKAYEEVHGVHCVTETPELIHSKLAELSQEIQAVGEKKAYEKALTINASYINDPKFRLMFLRAEYFDAAKAAHRLVKFLEHKLELFGQAALARSLLLSDLNKQDMIALKTGYFQLLPVRDRSGRAIFTDLRNFDGKSYKEVKNLVRAFTYLICAATEDEETQKNGVVGLGHYLQIKGNIDAESCFELNKAFDFLPVRICGGHLCTNNPFIRAAFPVLMASLPSVIAARLKLHNGTHTECMYSLTGFGFPVQAIPLTSEGEMKRKELLKWISKRKCKDEIIKFGSTFSGIDIPGNRDILLGRGKPINDHAGNIRMREMVTRFSEIYRTAPAEEKKVVVDQIVQLLQEESGRFLERREDGWYYVAPPERAVEKIELALRRSCRSAALNATSCAETTASNKKRRIDMSDSIATNLAEDSNICLPSC